jgi:predicted RNA-binding protein with PIN domain
MTHLLIDGYNLIRQIPALARHESISLADGRSALIGLLARYRKIKGIRVTVVFDGRSGLADFPEPYHEAGIGVVFSPAGSDADTIIKQWLAREKSGIVLISSDRELMERARSVGAGSLPAREFYNRVIRAGLMAGEAGPRDDDAPAKHKRWTTYKKGPSRRAPKKIRRNLNKTRPL